MRRLLMILYVLCQLSTLSFGQDAIEVLKEEIPNDADYGRTMDELIVSRGFQFETHEVVTFDGYILVLFRIINPLISPDLKRPVMIQHGLFASSYDFVIGDAFGHINSSIPSRNIAFTLAKEGYDVWLPNIRGNGVSNQHKWLDPFSGQFWDFSFDEIIKYDIPAIIAYILRVTSRASLGYIGHSQGTLIMFGLLSHQPQYADIVKPFIALAPVAYVSAIKGLIPALLPLRHVIAAVGGPLKGKPDNSTGPAGLCKVVPPACQLVANSLAGGFGSYQLDQSRLDVYIKNEPFTTSAKTVAHYAFNYMRKQFACYSPDGLTGSLLPTCLYNLGNIVSKDIALISGSKDELADADDVNTLRRSLRVPLLVDQAIEGWGHLDLIWGRDVPTKVMPVIRNVLERYRYYA